MQEDTADVDPDGSSLINPNPANREAVTIIEVAGRAVDRVPTPGQIIPNGKKPTLIVTRNGNTYRCHTRTRTKAQKSTFTFDCSKRRRKNCPFRFQAKIILTDDPKNSEFWIKENWKILEVFENHTCDETESSGSNQAGENETEKQLKN